MPVNFNSLPALLIAALLILSACKPEASDEWILQSPDGALQVTIANQAEGEGPVRLRYRLDRLEGEQITELLRWSPLGITRADADFSSGLQFLGDSERIVTDSYRMLRGKQLDISAEGRERTLRFREAGGQALEVIFRAYNDGIAFRYRFPEENDIVLTVMDEATGFRLPPSGRAWIQPYDRITKYTPAYERFFEGPVPVGQAAPGKEGWSFPALFQVGEQWIMLSESDLDGSYFGGHLQPEVPDGLYRIRMPEPGEARGTGEVQASSALPWTMPWRVVITGTGLGTVVESTLITDLARPSKLKENSWIEPGRASWSWWSDHPSSRNFDQLANFVDLAAELGWEYSLVDANWNTMEGGTIEQLIDYADEQGVGILMWYNSGGEHNAVEEQPRDRMWDAEVRDAEFRQLAEWGVRGVKVDFFQSDKPHIIQQYIDILEDAARYGLLVNFHGCTIPRGWDRTYPNLLTLESVRGGESYSFDEHFPEMAPSQNTIYAATRNVIGPMDYTPVTFSDNVYPHITTNAHELALAVVFESGIQHFADRVSAYTDQPKAVWELLSQMPVIWDETRFLGGTPGEDFLVARRHGDTWYVAGINGEGATKTFEPDLSFLEGSAWTALTVRDGETAREFSIAESIVQANAAPSVEVLPFGGFIMRIGKE